MPSYPLSKYRIWCETEQVYVHTGFLEDGDTPTDCPNDSAHTIDSDKTTVVEVIEDNSVVISADNSTPCERDGRKNFVSAPMTMGWEVMWEGKAYDSSDDSSTHVSWEFSGPGTLTRYVKRPTPWELRDGLLWSTPPQGSASVSTHGFTIRDLFTMQMAMPANTFTAPGSGGNCYADTTNGILIPEGVGGAPGTHQVTLASAVPAPADGGLWRVNHRTGVVQVPDEDTEADDINWKPCHLLIIDYARLIMEELPMGLPTGVMPFDTDKAEWFHQTWKLNLSIVKVSSGWGDAGGWIMTYFPGD